MFNSNAKRKIAAIEKIVDEQYSPLFRIMSVYDSDDSSKRRFGNNICAFHISHGYVLSVAHNLRTPAGVPNSLPEKEYQNILNILNSTQKLNFNTSYALDNISNKRHLNTGIEPSQLQQLGTILNQVNYDDR